MVTPSPREMSNWLQHGTGALCSPQQRGQQQCRSVISSVISAPEDGDAAALPQQLLFQVLKLLVRHRRLAVIVKSLRRWP